MGKTRIILWELMAMVAMMTVASCDDSDDVDYSVDIQKVKNAMPGTWTITNWEVRQGTDPLDEVPTDLTNAKVEYSETSFTVTRNGQPYANGTYTVSPYKFTIEHDGRKDTLYIIDVDRDTYKRLRLQKKVSNETSIVYNINKDK